MQPKERVSDPDEIKKHEFFNGIDWEKLAKREVPPPFSLGLKGTTDLTYFDPVG